MRRTLRITGTLTALTGAALIAWAVLVWQWQDPFTGAYNRWEQRQLAQSFERRSSELHLPAATASSPSGSQVALAARRWRKASAVGDPIARISISRLGLNAVVVNGTGHDSLKRGPGRYLGSHLPGEHELVYIAGHRTTYGAPFSRIDSLRKGDRIVLELPYATFTYSVTGSRVVAASDVGVLRSRHREQLVLQACHPRFFATHRWLTYATPVSVQLRTAPGQDGAAVLAG